MAKVGEQVRKAVEVCQAREGGDEPTEAVFSLAGVGRQGPEVFKIPGFRPVERGVDLELSHPAGWRAGCREVAGLPPGFVGSVP